MNDDDKKPVEPVATQPAEPEPVVITGHVVFNVETGQFTSKG